LAALQEHWSGRQPLVVDVRVDPSALREPEVEKAEPFTLQPGFEFERDRLYFLVRANNYDGRRDRLVWGPAVDARNLGAVPSERADVELPGGAHAWCDGGPRAGTLALPPGTVRIHRNHLEHGLLTPDHDDGVDGDTLGLAADQLVAV